MNASSLSSPVRVVVADDHPIVLAGLVGILSSDRGIRIVGQAEDGQQAVELIRKGGVDVLMLDLAMPGRAGLSLLRQLLDESAELRVIVFTAYDAASHKDRSLALGAAAYLAKGTSPQQIIGTHKVTVQKRLGANSVVDLVRYSTQHHLVPADG